MSGIIDEILSGDRIVYSFVSIWVVAIAIWLLLDSLGNRNRGVFRPKRETLLGDATERQESVRRKRAEEDAAVRSTLRDAYGSSSLRLTWTPTREAAAIAVDEQLVVPDPRYRHRIRRPAFLAVFDEPITEPLLGTYNPDALCELPLPPTGRWKLGQNPLMRNDVGAAPTAATLRRRVWKNHASNDVWGVSNQDRMRTGKPPQRFNPLTAKIEFCTVNPATATPAWPPARRRPVQGIAMTAPSEAFVAAATGEVEIDGHRRHAAIRLDLGSPAELTITRISATAKRDQAVVIHADGPMTVAGHTESELVLWASTAPTTVTVAAPAGPVNIWNAWRDGALTNAWFGAAGIEMSETDRGVRLLCSDGRDEWSVDLEVEIEVEMVPVG